MRAQKDWRSEDGTSDLKSEVEGNVGITLGGTEGGGGGRGGARSDGSGGSVGGTSSGGYSSVGLVRASFPGSTERLGEPILVPITLVRVERPWRISMAGISGNSDRLMASGCSPAGCRLAIISACRLTRSPSCSCSRLRC